MQSAKLALEAELLSTQSIMDSPQGKKLGGLSSISINVILISFLHLGTSQKSCRIRSSQGEPCVFPYIFNGEFYSECTTNFLEDSTDPMCPRHLENIQTLEASKDPKDWGRCAKKCDLQEYSSNQEIFEEIVELTSKYFYIAMPFTIGQSSKGQPLVGIRISQGVRKERKLMKPMVRFVGNMHGNEAVGREVLLHLSRHLLQGYEVVNISFMLITGCCSDNQSLDNFVLQIY